MPAATEKKFSRCGLAASMTGLVVQRWPPKPVLVVDGMTDLETVRRRKDGTQLVVALSVSPIEDAVGRVIGASTIARDVTDRKRAEAAEREAAALRSVASLATAAAHEINNPLTVVLGALEMLERRSVLDDATKQRFDRARARRPSRSRASSAG